MLFRSSIQQTALAELSFFSLNHHAYSELEVIAGLQYFSTISSLPEGFPVPTWLSFLLSARSALFLFEIIKIVSPSSKESSVINFFQKILELLER